ncbi:LysE family translocator [Lichenicoccus sp.]|uniref:LysE family translocator n=1 Tax=Lichenicoccus sp. TaxID=2781899 RepID=UPI003D0DDD0E
MSLHLPFVLASVVLMLIPGPNVALIVANSVGFGTHHGLLTVVGTASAMAVQLVAVWLGLASLLDALGHTFGWVRWIGAVYLVTLGLRQWRAPVVDLVTTAPLARSLRQVWLRAFLVSLTNPKTLLFYGAFFPQFVSSRADAGAQAATLCVVFLVVAVLVDCGWALAAGRARAMLGRHHRWRNRASAAVLIGAGAGLGLTRAP